MGVAGAGALVGRGLSRPGEPNAGFVIDPSVKSPTDKVKLGKSGITMSIVGIGTGSIGWNHESNQTRLGQEAFTRLIRHAVDSGITFFDLAAQYGSNPYFRQAIKGRPRE